MSVEAKWEAKWVFDVPSGTFRCSELSEEIVRAGMKRQQLLPFAQVIQTDRRRGEYVTVRKVVCLEPAPLQPLGECVPVPDEPTAHITETHIKVNEWGCAWPFTSLEADLGYFDPESALQDAMIQRVKKLGDAIYANAAKQTPVKYVNRRRGEWITNGNLLETAWTGWRATVARHLNITNLKGIRADKEIDGDALYGLVAELRYTYKAPTIDGNYVLFAGHNVAFKLRYYPGFVPVASAGAVPGEIGLVLFDSEMPGVRVIRVEDKAHVAPDDAILVGDEAVALSIGTEMHLRVAMPTDFGRSRFVALYGIYACGLIYPSANVGECRVIHATQGPAEVPFGRQVIGNIRGRVNRRKRQLLSGVGFFFRYLANKADSRALYDYDEEDDSCD
jgi:hypothetical protein